MNIAFLLALNNSFVLSMKVFLLSLLKTNPWFDYDILLLSDGNLSQENTLSLKSIYKKIKVIEANKNDYNNCLPTIQTWGYNLYYRFDVFDMDELGYDRIIVFDSDMVFLKDIKELFIYKNDFAACKKHLNISEIYPENPIEQRRQRFNCGLMSISKNILNKKIKKDLIKLATEKSWTSDQPIFNIYFADSVFYIPQIFNVVSAIATKQLLDDCVILQYHGFVKPWHNVDAEQCFHDEIKHEILKSSNNIISYKQTIKQLKNIFDSYSNIAKNY